ncbi:MAG: Maf family protein [Nanoarchaeota archaeon]
MKKKIILASTSSRRHSLLQQIGLEFEVVASNYEEDMTLDLPPAELAKTLARGKALEVAERKKSGLIIGVDTFISLDGKKIGKPKDKKDAKKILRMISNRTLKIYSGIALIDAQNKEELLDHVITEVKMRKITNQEIDSYIATGEPLDKAGAFAIQGLGAVFVSRINGCYFNVMGLPLYRLAKDLQKMGIDIFSYERWKNNF